MSTRRLNSKWKLLGLVSSPPILLLIAYKLNKYGIIDIPITKGLFYTSFLLIVLGIVETIRLLLKKEIGIGITLQSFTILILYCIIPIGMMATKISNSKNYTLNSQYKPKANLRTLLFAEPHYAMTEEEKNTLLQVTRSLDLGHHYTDILKLLPPVPEDCPIIMKTLNSGEIVLVYFIKKGLPDSEVNPEDHHITLRFDSNQNLKRIEEVI